jgi:hypothetical protein
MRRYAQRSPIVGLAVALVASRVEHQASRVVVGQTGKQPATEHSHERWQPKAAKHGAKRRITVTAAKLLDEREKHAQPVSGGNSTSKTAAISGNCPALLLTPVLAAPSLTLAASTGRE